MISRLRILIIGGIIRNRKIVKCLKVFVFFLIFERKYKMGNSKINVSRLLVRC